MEGENNGKPYFLMGWFGGKTHYFRKHPYNVSNLWGSLEKSSSKRVPLREAIKRELTGTQVVEPAQWEDGDYKTYPLLGFATPQFLGVLSVSNWVS